MTRTQVTGVAIGVLAAASLAACNAPPAKPAVDTGKIADAVKADEAQLVADFNAHDAAKVVSHDAPDVFQMGHGTPNVVGPAADLAANKTLLADPAQNFAVSGATVDVAASGDMAVYRSSYVYNFTDPKTKKPATESGNYLSGYKLQPDGSWKMEWSDISDTPASTPAASAG